ncbi:pimeloyl-ACP methyl ester carboxylesterase [Sphingomonas sp. BE138]|uniref:alpha/beta fold hydrolase n=1 Tax=Sphingomonas sp. BE138 TaxID=2817845 RepID=UPI00285D20C2|nr:alpha/beta hydrolase [Sphingomonas sp. BE138]MDR6786789.1 pimeloyl-ACP methyl ester carboxylesterase [Sphingomonas sp. BE138]
MASVTANGITIEYEDEGPRDGQPILMVMGLGAQLVRWPQEMVDALVAHGYRVIRFDNRDVGLSEKFDHLGAPHIVWTAMQMQFGRVPAVPYTLTDMAQDAIGLLDALGIERAHVVGASMGGMIAQLIAARWPERVRTLTSIMSTTGHPNCSRPTMRATALLLRHPKSDDIEAIVAHGTMAGRAVGGRFPIEDAIMADRIRAETLRNRCQAGFIRQMAAIIADGDRTDRLRRITAPTLVIHGSADPLVPVAGGRATAQAIAGARLMEIDGMGHTLPSELIDPIVAAIDDHIRHRRHHPIPQAA